MVQVVVGGGGGDGGGDGSFGDGEGAIHFIREESKTWKNDQKGLERGTKWVRNRNGKEWSEPAVPKQSRSKTI